MISRVVLAKLSPTMEEGTIVKWSKKEGDAVKVGDVLAEIETDKANMEMEALGAGVLRKILVPAGGKAPVGALIGVVADPKDDIGALLAQAPAAAAPVVAPAPAAPVPPPARVPAIAFCQGTPLRNEIEARDASRLGEATDVAAEAVAQRFGKGAVDGKIQAHIVTIEN